VNNPIIFVSLALFYSWDVSFVNDLSIKRPVSLYFDLQNIATEFILQLIKIEFKHL